MNSYNRIVRWVKDTGNNQWFDFLRLDLNAPYFVGKTGVYIIWYTNPSGNKVIRVGQGNIGDRLKAHRSDQEITKYSQLGILKVTWAVADGIVLSSPDLDGVEAYLASIYNPLIGERFPYVSQLSVNPIE